MKRGAPRPILITNAEHSQDDQLRRRQIRYVAMMGLRAVCLIAAAVLVTVRPPVLGLWLALCVLGMVLLPWLAVILANDRPPKERYTRRGRRQPEPEPPALVLPAPRADHPVIDPDP